MNIIGKLKSIGIEEAESAENRVRRELSRNGFRCISPSPETWSNGAKVVTVADVIKVEA